MFVAKLYKSCKESLKEPASVPYTTIEDETAIEARPQYEEETDSVWGYYGLKENHECREFYTISVGDDPQTYESLERMEESKFAGNARVMMINPLHHRPPRIVLHLQATCMCFDHNMVLHQWLVYAELEKKHIEPILGPCIG